MNKCQEEDKTLWNPYVAGIALGLVLFTAFFVTGQGIGGSGGPTRIGAWVLSKIAPSQVDQNIYLAPIAGGVAHPLHHPMVYMFLGTILGGLVSGLLSGRAQACFIKGPHSSNTSRVIFAILGGVVIGVGARIARGCTSGQALTGGAVLSLGSWIAMMMIFVGGYALAYPVRKLWR
jgi:uncharacterized membrane protein YedE/YeeE